jgi:hypothetical protein
LTENTTRPESRKYLCHYCYTKKGWAEVMPTGYEDLRKYRDIVKRAKLLDHMASTSSYRKL